LKRGIIEAELNKRGTFMGIIDKILRFFSNTSEENVPEETELSQYSVKSIDFALQDSRVKAAVGKTFIGKAALVKSRTKPGRLLFPNVKYSTNPETAFIEVIGYDTERDMYRIYGRYLTFRGKRVEEGYNYVQAAHFLSHLSSLGFGTLTQVDDRDTFDFSMHQMYLKKDKAREKLPEAPKLSKTQKRRRKESKEFFAAKAKKQLEAIEQRKLIEKFESEYRTARTRKPGNENLAVDVVVIVEEEQKTLNLRGVHAIEKFIKEAQNGEHVLQLGQ
jgi:hypothetical protein